LDKLIVKRPGSFFIPDFVFNIPKSLVNFFQVYRKLFRVTRLGTALDKYELELFEIPFNILERIF
jgi:hypothetical protein